MSVAEIVVAIIIAEVIIQTVRLLCLRTYRWWCNRHVRMAVKRWQEASSVR